MRATPERLLISVMAAFAIMGVTAVIIQEIELSAHGPVFVDPVPIYATTPAITTGASWFESVRAHCNPCLLYTSDAADE